MSSSRSTYARLAMEFVTIVLGVLVALAVDAYWQDRSDQATLDSYRSRLIGELGRNIEGLETVLRHAEDVRIAHDSVVAFFEKGSLPGGPDRVIANAYHASRRFGFSPLTSTFDDLVSTGHLALLDESTRAVLSYGYVSLRARGAPTWFGDSYRTAVRSVMPVGAVLAIREECTGPGTRAWDGCPLSFDTWGRSLILTRFGRRTSWAPFDFRPTTYPSSFAT